MVKQESWKRTEDIEIDLMDLLAGICMRWKQVLICALLGALILGGCGWLRGRNAAEAAWTGAAGDIELTEEEKQDVEAAVRLQEENRDLEEYLEESVLMRIDPYHKNRAVMLYSVEDARRQDLPKIVESYLSFASDGGAADELAESGSWNSDKSYLAELVSAYQKTYSPPYQIIAEEGMQDSVPAGELFYVEAAGESSEAAWQLASGIQAALEKAHAAVAETAGSHKLVLAGSGVSEAVDSDLQMEQHDKRALLQANKANLKTMTDAFSESQKAAYDREAGTEGQDGRTQGAGSRQGADAAGPAVSVKHIVIGLAGGIFIYCAFFACFYMFRDTVKSTDELKDAYAFPFYGGISLEKKAGGLWRRTSGVPGQKAGARAAGAGQDAVREREQAACRIGLACRNKGITQLCLASEFAFTSREKECLDEIISRLNERGIHAYLAENAGSDAALWDDMAKAGNVLAVCRIGTTTRRMIDDQMRFYMENGIAVAGAIAFT